MSPHLVKLCRENCWLHFFPDTVYIEVVAMCRFVSEGANMDQTSDRSSSSSSSHPASKPSTSQQQPQLQQQPTDIPEGLYDLLKGVTVAVLRDRPADLYSFVADYFTKVQQNSLTCLMRTYRHIMLFLLCPGSNSNTGHRSYLHLRLLFSLNMPTSVLETVLIFPFISL